MNFASRLEKLRLAKRITWNQLGDELGLSRSMLHYVRKGERDLGVLAADRLLRAEKAAGITTPLDIIREQSKLAETRADFAGSAPEDQQRVFNQAMMNPALIYLAEMKSDLKLLLKRIDVFESVFLSEAEKLINLKRLSDEQAAAKKGGDSLGRGHQKT